MKNKTKDLAIIGVLCAMAYVIMLVGRIPISPLEFLKYDPKDVVITIGGFIYGPATVIIISVIVSVIEMMTVSTTGYIGLIMNVISTVAFVCPAAYLYKKHRTTGFAVAGLGIGIICMVGVMLLWNYIATPIYMGIPREKVTAMLLPYILPFNLVKASINASLTMLLYKPIVTALRKAKLLTVSEEAKKAKVNVGLILASVIIIITCILFILITKNII